MTNNLDIFFGLIALLTGMEKSKTKIYSPVLLDLKNRRMNIMYSLQIDQQQLATQGSN